MNYRSGFKATCVAALVLAAVAAGAWAQETDTAYVPFSVNVDATVKAQAGAVIIEKEAVAGATDTLKLPLVSTAVRHTGGARGQLNVPAVSGSRGNITLRLPAQAYNNAEVALYSVNGRRVLCGRADASRAAGVVSRRNVAAGVYMLLIKGINGNSFTSRLTHRGGNMNINATFWDAGVSPAKQLGKKAETGDWMILATAANHYPYTATLSNLESGPNNPPLVITLTPCADGEDCGGGIAGLTMENYPRVDGSTSTNPLNYIIAANLLGLEYEWQAIQDIRNVVFKNPALASEFEEKLQCSQTHGAIVNLIDNETDLIIVARKMSPDEKQHADGVGVSLIETPIALDALDFIVNNRISVNSLLVEQIQDIYLGKITRWDEVGGADNEIIPFIRNANSGSQEMMNEIVMKNTDMPDWDMWLSEEEYHTIGGMIHVYMTLVYNPLQGICFTPHYYKEYMVGNYFDGMIKTLAINAVAPDSNSIKNKTYPFVAEVYVSIRSDVDRNSMAYKLYKWLQTDAGKRVIRESGYVPN